MLSVILGWLWSLWPIIRLVAPIYLSQLPSFTSSRQYIRTAMVLTYDVVRRRLGEGVQRWTPSPSVVSGLIDWAWPWLVALFVVFLRWSTIAATWILAAVQGLVVMATPFAASFAASFIEWAVGLVRDGRVVFRWAFGEDLWPFTTPRARVVRRRGPVVGGRRRVASRATSRRRPNPVRLVFLVATIIVCLLVTPISSGCVRSGETMVCGGGLCDPTPARDLERLLLNGDSHAPTPEAVLGNYPNLKVRDYNPFSHAHALTDLTTF